jgi:hypothetical protein
VTDYENLDWISGECFIRLAYPDGFNGYDEEGNACFTAVSGDIEILGKYPHTFRIHD